MNGFLRSQWGLFVTCFKYSRHSIPHSLYHLSAHKKLSKYARRWNHFFKAILLFVTNMIYQRMFRLCVFHKVVFIFHSLTLSYHGNAQTNSLYRK